MLVSIKGRGRPYYTVIDIPSIVENRPTSGTSADKPDWVFAALDFVEIDFHPRVLVPPNDHAWSVCVEE
jgi:hypothetical protein